MTNAPILIVVIPIFTALVITLLDLTRIRAFSGHLAIVCLGLSFGFALTLAPQILGGENVIYTLGSWDQIIGVSLLVDHLSLFMVLLGNFLGFLVLIHSLAEGKYNPKFYALVLIMMSGISGAFLSGDIFNLFVFMEVLSISSYILVAHYGHKGSLLAGINYLLISSVGIIFLLFGIGILYRYIGTLNMIDMGEKIPRFISESPRAIILMLALFIVGFGVKCAMFPLHTWLPDAHSIAPSPVSALLSGIVIKVGIYALLRTIQIFRLSPIIGSMYTLLLYTGAVTAVFGAIMALVQSDLKRLLAYSSINQIGYILIGIGLGTELGTTGAWLHIANHGVAKSCLFLCAGTIIERTGRRKISELALVAKEMPGITTIFILASLSLMGIPPAGGFFSKLMIGLSSAKGGHPIIALLIFSTSIITGAYFLRCIGFFFRGQVEHSTLEKKFSSFTYLPLVLLVSGVFIVVFFPWVGEKILSFTSMPQEIIGPW